MITPCPNVNCIEGPHPWCQNCTPYFEPPQLCHVCRRPSRGGRRLCCKAAVCQQCHMIGSNKKLPCPLCMKYPGYVLIHEKNRM
jgi:hypothetical protein